MFTEKFIVTKKEIY